MTTDLEADLRREFDAASPPSSLTYSTDSVLRQGSRTIRRRRIIAAGSAALAVAVVATGASLFARPHNSAHPLPAAGSSATSPSGAASSTVAACTGAQLSGKVFRTSSQSSQPFAEIVLTNRGPGRCQLSGYPELTAWGSAGRGPTTQLETVLTQGSTYEIADPGQTTVVIAAAQTAWFAVGTGTAYGGPIVTIDRLVIDVGSSAGGKANRVNVALGMDADGPPGKAIPITITAFAPGVPPKP